MTEPDISKVPFMIDSSKFEVVVAGLRCVQVRVRVRVRVGVGVRVSVRVRVRDSVRIGVRVTPELVVGLGYR